MSEHPQGSNNPQVTAAAAPQPRRRRWWLRVLGSLVLLLALLVGGLSWYSTTDDFQHRVGAEVVKVLENATGARVELGQLHFNLWHLAIEVDGLVLHGTEPAGQLPYLSAQKILVRLKINTFLTHIRGLGPQSRIGLSYLRVEQPVFHLIVDKDGHTNQPVPPHPSTSTTPLQDTLLNLQAGQVELVDGLAVLNDRAVPFNLAARQLSAQVQYLRTTDRYGATVALEDLATQLAQQPEVHSQLHLTAELGRDMAALTSLEFATGKDTRIEADGQLQHFNSPQWQAEVGGDIDLHQLGLLANVPGFAGGKLNLFLNGHSCALTPQAAQEHPHFWQRHRPAGSHRTLPPDPHCAAGYLLAGAIRFRDVNYDDPNVRVRGVSGGAELHVTPTQLLFTALTGQLPGGGGAGGELKINNWLGEAPPAASADSPSLHGAATTANRAAQSMGAKAPIQAAPKAAAPTGSPAEAFLRVTVDHITLRTIMDITAPPHYGDLGYDTSITGPVQVTWGGPARDIGDTVQVQADLNFAPTGKTRPGLRSNVPISGHLLGHYDGSTQVVRVTQLNVHTPESALVAQGILGVSRGDPLTALQANLQISDLGEFDQLLQTLGLTANGKTGAAAIPVELHGTLDFNGQARGALRDLDLKGHLTAENLDLQLSSAADIHLDSVVGDAEYSPSAGVAIAESTFRRGTAVLHVTGKFAPHRSVSRRDGVSYAWDGHTALDATVSLADAQAADLLQIAGQQQRLPVTGTVALQAQLGGTVDDLQGSGHLQLLNGTAYGEPYQSLALEAVAQGRLVTISQVQLRAHGDLLTASGSYDLSSRHITAKVLAPSVHLAKYASLARLGGAAGSLAGTLALRATADGTLQVPNLHARLQLAELSVQGKPLGDLNATADSAGSLLSYTLQSDAAGAQLAASGHTQLQGQYMTQAQVHIAGLNAATLMALFAPDAVRINSNITAEVSVSGPAAQPRQLSGTAQINALDLHLEGMELRSAEPVRLALNNGTATLQALHITGPDTDLHAAGSLQLFTDAAHTSELGGALNVKAYGSVSTALAHTFDKDIIAAGKVTFQLQAGGHIAKPELTGNVRFQNVDLAVEGVSNGLSNMNGTLVFNEDRLEVKDLVATTGGGQLRLGGYLSYQKGIFADVTATGDAVRIRYAGLSATATAHLRLQGSLQSILLSGSVLVTRFGIGPDVDFASFAGSGGLAAPPDPNAPTNKVRLDVRVTSAPQLDFQNSYAKLAGTVDVTVRGTLAQPTLLGRIQITDGSATFAGTNYQLQRGTITFSNPVRIDPTIDLDATARVENYDITIGLHGTPSSLKPTYRSEPPLTEADIFNLLALGRTQEEAQLYQEQQVQAGTDPTTSALLGGALNATVSNRVSKLFGAGSIKIDPAFVGTLGNSTARITVQEPLSKQLTVVFATNVNQTAEQLIQLQYQINQNTSLVATRDESGVFSIVYKIRKRYR